MALHFGLTSHGGVLEGLVLHLVEPYDTRRGICGDRRGLAGDDCRREVEGDNCCGDLSLGVEVAAGFGDERGNVSVLLFSVINVVSVSFDGVEVER